MGFRVTKCFFCQIKTLTDVLRVEGVHFFSISMLVTMALSVVFNAVFVSRSRRFFGRETAICMLSYSGRVGFRIVS